LSPNDQNFRPKLQFQDEHNTITQGGFGRFTDVTHN